VYLPLLLREEPCWSVQPLDVAIVLDTSSSMLEERPSKLEGAQAAIAAFVDNLKGTDQVAVVTFNSEARVVQELTKEHSAAIAAVWAVQTGHTTRIDLAVQAASAELTSARSRADAAAIMIVLTDGLPNPVGPAEVLREAGLAKDAGILIFTIGLGADVDRQLLVSAASSPDLYSEAPTGADLKEIYQGLLVRVPCDPRIYWGRR
jgi:Ca-activated chloride channel family protein